MILYKNVNGIDIPLTESEEAEYQARQAEFELLKLDRTKKLYADTLAALIDNKAHEKEYKDAVSCASYAQSTNEQWAAEAQAFVAWRDAVYLHAYDVLNRVTNGEIEEPSIESFLESLPTLTWPN